MCFGNIERSDICFKQCQSLRIQIFVSNSGGSVLALAAHPLNDSSNVLNPPRTTAAFHIQLAFLYFLQTLLIFLQSDVRWQAKMLFSILALHSFGRFPMVHRRQKVHTRLIKMLFCILDLHGCGCSTTLTKSTKKSTRFTKHISFHV